MDSFTGNLIIREKTNDNVSLFGNISLIDESVSETMELSFYTEITNYLGSLMIQVGKSKKDAIVEIKIDMKGKVEYMASWWKDGNTSGIIVSPTSNSSAIVTKLVAVAKKEETKSANAKAAELLGVNKKKKTAKKTTTKKAPAKKAEPAKTEQPSVLDMFDELNPEEIEDKATKKAPAKKAASKAPAKKTAKKK